MREAATKCSLEEAETLLLDEVQLLRDKVAFKNQVEGAGLGIEAFKCKLQESTMLEARMLDRKLSQRNLFKDTSRRTRGNSLPCKGCKEVHVESLLFRARVRLPNATTLYIMMINGPN